MLCDHQSSSAEYCLLTCLQSEQERRANSGMSEVAVYFEKVTVSQRSVK